MGFCVANQIRSVALARYPLAIPFRAASSPKNNTYNKLYVRDWVK